MRDDGHQGPQQSEVTVDFFYSYITFLFTLHFTLHYIYISFLHYQWKETTINLAILHKEKNPSVSSRQNSHVNQALSTASK